MDMQILFEKIVHLESLLLVNKRILNLDELSKYTGFSKSTLYKKVQRRVIPSSNPDGKKLFFDREKIDEWLLSASTKSQHEIMNTAQKYVYGKRTK